MAHVNHDALAKKFSAHFQLLFGKSSQPIYAFLDDQHIVVNSKFAKMLGYPSVKACEGVRGSFLDSFVQAKSHGALVKAYRAAVESYAGSSIPITWKAKSGKSVSSKVILVPIPFEDHVFALHFITK